MTSGRTHVLLAIDGSERDAHLTDVSAGPARAGHAGVTVLLPRTAQVTRRRRQPVATASVTAPGAPDGSGTSR